MTEIEDPTTLFVKVSPQGIQPIPLKLIEEQAVTLSVNGADWLTLQCTPESLRELAIGFLYNESIINDIREVEHVKVCKDQSGVDAWLTHAAERPLHWQRPSGCAGGVNAMHTAGLMSLVAEWQISAQTLLAGMAALYQVEGLYQEYRGLHCSALFNGERIQFHAADIGRHNTLDKLAGMLLLSSETIDQPTLLTTGRISSEMLHKATRMGCAVVASRTTPTRLAVQSAQTMRVTLVGYARHDSFVIYAGSERIQTV